MNQIRFPIDPLNPGHYYACCGLLELASREDANAESIFACDSRSVRRAEFAIRTEQPLDLPGILSDLQDAEAELEDHPETAVKPVRLKLKTGDLVLDWWLDYFRENTQNLKCWAGQVTTAKLMEELRRMLPVDAGPGRLFYEGEMMKTKFGIDPRSAWNALDVGYSPNEHNQDASTFPAVELLGAIGLQGYRPLHRTREEVPFHLWGVWLGRLPARRAAVAPWAGLSRSSMKFKIAKRGQSYKYFTFAEPQELKTGEQRHEQI